MARITFVLLLTAALAAGWIAWDLHGKNLRSARHVADLRRRAAGARFTVDEVADNRPIQQLQRSTRGEDEVRSLRRAELQAARLQLTIDEQRARAAYHALRDKAPTQVTNSDPQHGMAPLELLQNVGRETPETALQTIVWAALHGDDTTLLPALTLTETARAKADDLLAKLPAGSKSYTPEKLASLYLTDHVLKTGAIEVVGREEPDPQHATVLFRRLETGEQVFRLPMVESSGGWQLVLSDKAIADLQSRMAEIATSSTASDGLRGPQRPPTP